MDESTEIVATFRSRLEAEFALETLRAAGIRAILLADDAGGALAGVQFSGPARILADPGDVAEARALIGAAGESGSGDQDDE